MADTKLTALTNIDPITDDDEFYVVDDPGGTPVSRAVLASVVAAYVGKTKTIVKQADETVNNSTTLQNDDELTFSIAANEDVAVTFVLYCDVRALSDFKAAVTAPTSATVRLSSDSDTRGSDALMEKTTHVSGSGTSLVLDTRDGDYMLVFQASVINGANAGSVTLQWAQGAAQVFDTKVYAGSSLVARFA